MSFRFYIEFEFQNVKGAEETLRARIIDDIGYIIEQSSNGNNGPIQAFAIALNDGNPEKVKIDEDFDYLSLLRVQETEPSYSVVRMNDSGQAYAFHIPDLPIMLRELQGENDAQRSLYEH